MPNIKAAIKSLRQTKKRQLKNQIVKSELHTLTRKVRTFMSENKKDEAVTALKLLESKLAKAAKKNIIKKNSVSRKIGRLKSQCFKLGSKK